MAEGEAALSWAGELKTASGRETDDSRATARLAEAAARRRTAKERPRAKGGEVGSWRDLLVATCRRAGIRNLHFHDLGASSAAEHDVRDFLGHANITTTSRYLRNSPLRLERALAMMSDGFPHEPSRVEKNGRSKVSTDTPSTPGA